MRGLTTGRASKSTATAIGSKVDLTPRVVFDDPRSLGPGPGSPALPCPAQIRDHLSAKCKIVLHPWRAAITIYLIGFVRFNCEPDPHASSPQWGFLRASPNITVPAQLVDHLLVLHHQ